MGFYRPWLGMDWICSTYSTRYKIQLSAHQDLADHIQPTFPKPRLCYINSPNVDCTFIDCLRLDAPSDAGSHGSRRSFYAGCGYSKDYFRYSVFKIVAYRMPSWSRDCSTLKLLHWIWMVWCWECPWINTCEFINVKENFLL